MKYVPVSANSDSESHEQDKKAEEERLELRNTLVTTHLPKCRLAIESESSDSAANLVRGIAERENGHSTTTTTSTTTKTHLENSNSSPNRREIIST